MDDKSTALDSSNAVAVPERGEHGRLKPGGPSLNPGGKSLERERLRRLVYEHGQDAIDGILELARGAQSEKVRLAAWIWMAEQVVGKATQIVTGADGGPIAIDTSTALLEALQRMAQLRNGNGGGGG